MSAESWQNACPRCGWANSGAERRCMKCGQTLRTSPGLLVAGEGSSSRASPSAAANRRVVQPGGFFPRLIALIIDVLILGVIVVPLIYLWVGQAHANISLTPQAGNLFTESLKALGGSAFDKYTTEQLTQLLQLSAGIIVLALFYYVGTWSILGGSPGQQVMGLRIVDTSVKTIGFGRAVLRFLMKVFFVLLLPVSVLMVAFTRDKRAIHDLLAGTYVIQFLDPTLADLDAILPPAPAAAPAPAQPTAPPPPSTPPAPAAPTPPPLAPAAPPPDAPGDTAFERYAEPAGSPSTPTPPTPPSSLPVFPMSDPGGLQPMAPPPKAPTPGPSTPPEPSPLPYPLPFGPLPNPPAPPGPPPGGDSPDHSPTP